MDGFRQDMYLYCNSSYADCVVHLVSEPFGESLCKSGSFISTQSNCRLFLYDAFVMFFSTSTTLLTNYLTIILKVDTTHTYSLYILFASGICSRCLYLFLVVSLAALAFPFSDSGRNELLCDFLWYPVFWHFSG